MIRRKIYNAHNAVAADHSHVFSHPVFIPFVYRDQVVMTVQGAADDLCRNKALVFQKRHLILLCPSAVLRNFGDFARQCAHLLLQIQVALREFFVGLCE